MDNEKIKFSRDIKGLSLVDTADRSYVRNIVMGIYQFEDPMPLLESEVYPTPDHYNLIIKGWAQYIDWESFYKKYFDKKERAPLYDPIISGGIDPVTDEGIPVIKIHIRKSSFSKQKRK